MLRHNYKFYFISDIFLAMMISHYKLFAGLGTYEII